MGPGLQPSTRTTLDESRSTRGSTDAISGAPQTAAKKDESGSRSDHRVHGRKALKIMRFTKQDFALMAVGVLFFVADIVADIWQATEYFYEEHYLWGTLLLAIGLISSVIIQFFSHAWFKEDTSGNLKWIFLLLHFLHGWVMLGYCFNIPDRWPQSLFLTPQAK
ncbi:XK-related protein 9, partial [Varanus komodoensis]